MEHKLQNTFKYIQETIGLQATAIPLAKSYMDRLPMYIHETYKLYSTNFFKTGIILAEVNNEEELSILQTEKQIQQIENQLNQKVVIVLENVQAYIRKRLIEKGINFIVPGKQLYLPSLLIDLRESYTTPRSKQKKEALLPSAQFLLIFHIIKKLNLEEQPFKTIARKVGYTPMAITNAVNNLQYHKLVDVQGEKEKFIRFRFDRHELWNRAQQQKLLVNPVIKTVFVDEKPKNLFLFQSNTSALPEYTDLNPSKQLYFAIEKSLYYGLQKNRELVNPNEFEGKYALEIWKYNPKKLVNDQPGDLAVVDPLSLYLSLKESGDERIEIALDQIIEKFIW